MRRPRIGVVFHCVNDITALRCVGKLSDIAVIAEHQRRAFQPVAILNQKDVRIFDLRRIKVPGAVLNRMESRISQFKRPPPLGGSAPNRITG